MFSNMTLKYRISIQYDKTADLRVCGFAFCLLNAIIVELGEVRKIRGRTKFTTETYYNVW